MLTNGNSKLGTRIYSFGMSLESCRHKTESCKRYCYANKGTFRTKSVSNYYKQNFKESKKSNFVSKMKAEISYLAAVEEIKFIRIHSSGDFYSQVYFNKWVEIAKSFPKITFLAYTRNYDIDCGNRPKNLQLIFSKDKTTKKINKTIDRIAEVIAKEFKSKPHMAEHKENNSRICMSKCKFCKYCYIGKGNISFPEK